MAAAAHGSLMGARGNSGVILLQILRGLAQGLTGRTTVDAKGIAKALTETSAVAYRAVMKPTEGTHPDGRSRSRDGRDRGCRRKR